MAVSTFLKNKQAHNAIMVKARGLRKQKAFNAAVGLTLGDSVAGWLLAPDGSTVTRHREGKQDRVYPIDRSALNARVEELQQERAKAAEKKAQETPTAPAPEDTEEVPGMA
jgi:hypothetical protein